MNTSELRKAENELIISELDFHQKVIDVTAETEALYWRLYSSKQELEVKQKSLETAMAFRDEVQARINLGILPGIDSLQAESEIVAREEDVIIGENIVMNLQDEFASYIMGYIPSDFKILPLEDPDFSPQAGPDEAEHIGIALEKRPDYRAAELRLANRGIDVVYYENQKLPDISLSGSLGLNDPDENSGVFDDLFSGDYYSASVGVTIQYPLNPRADRANYLSARYSEKQGEVALRQKKEDIILEVRKAIRDIRAGEKRCRSAGTAMELGRQKLGMEEDRFRQGLSTAYAVLEHQRDLTDAEVRYVKAVISYQLARVDLYKADGTVLEKYNIEIKSLAE